MEITLDSGKNYAVYKKEKPFLLICADFDNRNFFSDVCIFYDRLYVGNGSNLFIINLTTFSLQIIEMNMYFGYFYKYQDNLFVASGCDITCFLKNGKIKWKTGYIAIDGITFCDCNNGILTVSCCMDPSPAIWYDKRISLDDGSVK